MTPERNEVLAKGREDGNWGERVEISGACTNAIIGDIGDGVHDEVAFSVNQAM